jgi:hypothetical protein
MRDTWSRLYSLINDFNAAINAYWPDHRPSPDVNPRSQKSIHQANGLATGSARRHRAQPIDVTGEDAIGALTPARDRRLSRRERNQS